jgi:thiosulfate/3-mercaptopyruvate sulfurtransferase
MWLKAEAARRVRLWLAVVLTLSGIFLAASPSSSVRAAQSKVSEPWAESQNVTPEKFARELRDRSVTPPTVVYVGFRTLFSGGHIPWATFHGTASTEQGLAELKKWAESLPRSMNLVIYCGCCPFEKCPNIRPAYIALASMGFKQLRVLVLPTSFAADWVDKGYPVQKGM